MTWLSTSIMARKGVAKGVERTHHKLTIEDQGTFHYVYGPYVDPVFEVVTVETHDAFEGAITEVVDSPSALKRVQL